MQITDKITITNEDNMEMMARYPDGHFGLAIVDPPYFKGAGAEGFYGKKFTNQGTKKGHYKGIDNWDDNIPNENYFKELLRVSKNQIVWGVNYYPFSGLNSGRIIWDKKNDTSTFSNCEIASNSLISHVKIFRFLWNGMLQEDMLNKESRIHPTQKPVALYKWLLKNYAKQGDKILDTHLGSMSIAIAAFDLGFELVGCELDKDYFNSGIKRLKNHIAFNQSLFSPEELLQPTHYSSKS